MAYIGNVYIPSMAEMPEPQQGNVEVIKGLGIRRPLTVTHDTDLVELDIDGMLYLEQGTVKTAQQYAEDLRGLLRDAAYNYMYFNGVEGFIALQSVPTLNRASRTALKFPYSLKTWFQPASQFQRQYKTNPAIRANEYNITLGDSSANSYIALPIGATYSGSTGDTITRTSKDGTITLVEATTDGSHNIKFDLPDTNEVDVGECKVWDTLIAGSTTEADWIKVINPGHDFTGNAVIENGLYRVQCDVSNNYLDVSYYSGSAYTRIDQFSHASYNAVWFTELTPDRLKVALSSGTTIEINRGHPALIDTGTTDLVAVSLTPADQSANSSTDNFLVLATNQYICSDNSFNIVNSTKNLDSGKKWIYRETNAITAIQKAHQALVNQNLRRGLILR